MAPTKRQLHREVALWIIRLNCDDPVQRQSAQNDFKHWQQQHPECLDYFEQIHLLSEEMQSLPQQHALAGKTMHKTFADVQQAQLEMLKKIGKTSLMIASIGALAYLSYTYLPFEYYWADYKTTVARPNQFILEDGSKITLDAKSAIDVDFSPQQRHIKLIQGALYIDVAQDRNRPLIIHTPQASFRALGTKFIVHKDYQSSSLNMLESEVSACLHTDQNHQCQIVKYGQSIKIDQKHIQDINIDIAKFEKAWQSEQILAQEMPLSDLLHRLNSYHDGFIIFNQQEFSQIKVTGVIDRRQNLDLSLALIKSQYPQVEFIRIGKWLSYAKIKK